MSKKNGALLAVLIVVIAALAIILVVKFGGGDSGDTTTTAPEETSTSASDETTGPDADETTLPGETATLAPGETTLPGATALPGETTTLPVKAPSTKEEVVAYFNTAAAKVKTEKPGFSKSVKNYIDSDNIHVDNSALNYIAGKAVNVFSDSISSVTVTQEAKGGDHSLFPPRNNSAALSAADVSSATCEAKNGVFEITIKMNPEKLSDLPSNPYSTKHGKAFNVLNAGEVYEQTDKIPGININYFKPTYKDCYIKCTVDPATGAMRSAVYYFNTFAEVGAKVVFSELNASVEFAIEETYTINK